VTLTKYFVIITPAMPLDVVLAFRMLTRRAGFTAVAVATLALGIGAPTAIFSVVHAVLLRPLPYRDADRIVRLSLEIHGPGGTPFDLGALPTATALDWGTSSATLSALALFNDSAMTLSSAEGPFRLAGVAATPNLFDLLGASPAIGRAFDPAAHDAREVVLSDATWKRHFNGSPGIVGSSITLDGRPYTVSGVMPGAFAFPTPETAYWVPLLLDPGQGRGMVLPVIARLLPNATLAAAIDEGRRRLGEDADARVRQTIVGRTLQDEMVGNVRRLLWVLMAAVGFVFVIATANIALLLLTRGAARERELSVRLALGAARGRLVRQLFVEGLVLAAIGGAAGLLLSELALQLLVASAPASLPRLHEVRLDGQVLAFTVAVTLATSLAFGVLSAGRTVAIDAIRALAAGGESRLAPAAGPRRRLNLLAATEIALTMVLLVGAGLLIRSFVGLVLVDQGFTPRGAVAMQISLPAARYPNPAARLAFHERLLERLQRVDGVAAAGLITAMPNRQPSGRFDYDPKGVPVVHEPFSQQIVEVRMASEGFLEAMGIPLLAGRTFRAGDAAGAEPVMVISERLARQHFAGVDPIGRTLYSGTGNRRVIGVVGDVKPIAPGPQSAPSAYLPVRQDSSVFRWFASMNIVVRGTDTRAMAAEVRALVLSLDPEMPPFNVRTLDEEVSSLTAGPRFSAMALAMFAGVALVMAAVGVYGVIAYSVGMRTREIGVRIALGASRRQVLRLVIRDGIAVVAGGLVAGLVAATWLARGLTGLLHEVRPADPIALASVGALLTTVGIVAAYLPARRATRVSVLDALRDQ
jgi:putative ABC transport system permease protein